MQPAPPAKPAVQILAIARVRLIRCSGLLVSRSSVDDTCTCSIAGDRLPSARRNAFDHRGSSSCGRSAPRSTPAPHQSRRAGQGLGDHPPRFVEPRAVPRAMAAIVRPRTASGGPAAAASDSTRRQTSSAARSRRGSSPVRWCSCPRNLRLVEANATGRSPARAGCHGPQGAGPAANFSAADLATAAARARSGAGGRPTPSAKPLPRWGRACGRRSRAGRSAARSCGDTTCSDSAAPDAAGTWGGRCWRACRSPASVRCEQGRADSDNAVERTSTPPSGGQRGAGRSPAASRRRARRSTRPGAGPPSLSCARAPAGHAGFVAEPGAPGPPKWIRDPGVASRARPACHPPLNERRRHE